MQAASQKQAPELIKALDIRSLEPYSEVMFESSDHECPTWNDCDECALADSEAVRAIEARDLSVDQVERVVLVGWAKHVGIDALSPRVVHLELIYALGIDTSSMGITKQVGAELNKATDLLVDDLADMALWTGNAVLQERIEELRSC